MGPALEGTFCWEFEVETSGSAGFRIRYCLKSSRCATMLPDVGRREDRVFHSGAVEEFFVCDFGFSGALIDRRSLHSLGLPFLF